MSFAPGELSTIEGSGKATKAFDFEDLPCPPSAVAEADSFFYNPSVDPGEVYDPLLAPPPGIFNIDPAWANCVTAINQGFDPPIALQTAAGLTGPGNHFGPPRRRRRALAHDGNIMAAHRALEAPLIPEGTVDYAHMSANGALPECPDALHEAHGLTDTATTIQVLGTPPIPRAVDKIVVTALPTALPTKEGLTPPTHHFGPPRPNV